MMSKMQNLTQALGEIFHYEKYKSGTFKLIQILQVVTFRDSRYFCEICLIFAVWRIFDNAAFAAL